MIIYWSSCIGVYQGLLQLCGIFCKLAHLMLISNSSYLFSFSLESWKVMYIIVQPPFCICIWGFKYDTILTWLSGSKPHSRPISPCQEVAAEQWSSRVGGRLESAMQVKWAWDAVSQGKLTCHSSATRPGTERKPAAGATPQSAAAQNLQA